MQELIKIIGLLPVKDGKAALFVIKRTGPDFQIAADMTAAGNTLGIENFTIGSETLKKLGVQSGETAYIVETGDANAPYRVEYESAPEVAGEALGKGRGATPNFSIQR